MQRVPFAYTKDYTITLEYVTDGEKIAAFIHADIRRWDKEIYKELKEKWKEFRSLYTQPIYAFPEKESTAKFAKMFGFKPLGLLMRHRV